MSDQKTDEKANELAVLLREGSTVQIRDRAVRVAPITMKHLSPFARAVLPIAHAAAPVKDGTADLAAINFAGANWLDLVMWHGPDCIAAVSLATGEPEEWLGELNPDEMVQLIAEVVAVNMDFFVRSLAPAIKAALGRIGHLPAAVAAAAGPTPGSDSSSTATAAPT